MTDVVLLLTVVALGLQAGTYYTWASGMMPGLARAEDRTFVDAMQRVNVAIVNPVFLASFLGAPALAIASVVLTDGDARWWAWGGAMLAVATLLVTFVGNIPLNNRLDAAGPLDRIADVAAVRTAFESRWVRLNIARTVSSLGALACLAWTGLLA